MKDSLIAKIEREAAHARAGKPARIVAKMNGLSDTGVIRALIAAGKDGVDIRLVCRSVCTLRPGVPEVSTNIHVSSVVGRFLEHSRIYRFDNAGSPETFLGSADLRPRNLSRRVELLARVEDPIHLETLGRILQLYVDDPTGWDLLPSGRYERRGATGPATQQILVNEARSAQPISSS
jgi:polyphosphate kinase